MYYVPSELKITPIDVGLMYFHLFRYYCFFYSYFSKCVKKIVTVFQNSNKILVGFCFHMETSAFF